jgi:hypothetical protein
MSDGEYIHLVSESGTKLGIKRRIERGVDAVSIARLMILDSVGRKRSSFNRKLVYPAGF